MTGYEWPLRMTGYGGPTGNGQDINLLLAEIHTLMMDA